MKKTILILMTMLFCFSLQTWAEGDDKVKLPIPPGNAGGWEEDNDRSLNTPQLFQNDAYVYVYSEKQLDNLTIGITDMQGNVYYQEVTTVPACTYYAVFIESLPEGMYYLCIYQGSNYVIGMFNKN